jgi:hypothetical protein
VCGVFLHDIIITLLAHTLAYHLEIVNIMMELCNAATYLSLSDLPVLADCSIFDHDSLFTLMLWGSDQSLA